MGRPHWRLAVGDACSNWHQAIYRCPPHLLRVHTTDMYQAFPIRRLRRPLHSIFQFSAHPPLLLDRPIFFFFAVLNRKKKLRGLCMTWTQANQATTPNVICYIFFILFFFLLSFLVFILLLLFFFSYSFFIKMRQLLLRKSWTFLKSKLFFKIR